MPAIGTLTFHEPDHNKFECLKLAFNALNAGGTAPCILNAANEVAVGKFLNKEIKFSHISLLINKALDRVEVQNSPGLETIIDCDRRTRQFITELI